jgi:hypothetical protein
MAKAPNPPFSRVFVAKLVSLLTYLLAAAPHTSSYESSLLWLKEAGLSKWEVQIGDWIME